jgi:hypothetical protein
MSTPARPAKALLAVAPQRGRPDRRPAPQHGGADASKAPQSRAQQKSGAYKRLEVFLGVEAAIALRVLMRDGRSAREVIEGLLIAERQRRKPREPDALPQARGQPGAPGW